jgi:hypothetical protein
MRWRKEADRYRDLKEGVRGRVLSSGKDHVVKKGWREKRLSILMSEPVRSFDYFEGER